MSENQNNEALNESAVLASLPKGLESFVNKDLLSINAKVDIESNVSLPFGTLLISEDYGRTFVKCPNLDISASANARLGMLKDDAFKTGVYGVLLMGEIVLESAHQSAVNKAFLQNLIIKTKE